jgi:hypothetical protein
MPHGARCGCAVIVSVTAPADLKAGRPLAADLEHPTPLARTIALDTAIAPHSGPGIGEPYRAIWVSG